VLLLTKPPLLTIDAWHGSILGRRKMLDDEKFRYHRFRIAWHAWAEAVLSAGLSQKELEIWTRFLSVFREVAAALWKEEGEISQYL
jgi:hypothetical protein